MAANPILRHVAPRLALLFAVLACMLGLGLAGAASASAKPSGGPLAVAAGAEHGGHIPGSATAAAPTTQPTAAAASTSTTGVSTSEQAAPSTGGGHGEHNHELSCMASSVAALAAFAASDAAVVLGSAFALSPPRLHTLRAVAGPRAPSLATLCVQRI